MDAAHAHNVVGHECPKGACNRKDCGEHPHNEPEHFVEAILNPTELTTRVVY